MSNEIQVQILLSCTHGEFKFPQVGTPQSIDQNGIGGGCPGFIIVGVAEEDISLADLTTPGYVYIKNLGETGTGTNLPKITYGPKSGGNLIPFGELQVGEEACFRLTSTSPTFTIKSDSDSTGVQIYILED